MEDAKILRKIELTGPAMIAAWPGMGNVALGAVDYLRRKLKAVKFAEIRTDPMTALDSVVVERGFAKLPKPPANSFYYLHHPDIVIFEGESQLAGSSGIELLEKTLDLAAKLNVRRIYTGAAFPMPVSYNEVPELYGAVNMEKMKGGLKDIGAKAMEGGHISGLNGLLLAFAAKRGIEAVCLLATMPQYAISLPNPKASSAIIEALAATLHFRVDLDELKNFAKEMDEKMAAVEEHVKDVLTIDDKKEDMHPPSKEVPAYIIERIEKMFLEARQDKTKAMTLKRELDRWDLYGSYEDRFLDLFRESQ